MTIPSAPEELMARAEARISEPATKCYCAEIAPYACLICRAKAKATDG